MWLLTAVGPVHGQRSFTFVLEQRKEYTLGRDKSCNIRFEDRYVKPIQGKIIVSDWDPNQPGTAPELRWKSEPSKKGVYPAFKTLLPSSEDNAGSTDRADYESTDMPEGVQGCHLDNKGMGIELGEISWFTTTWLDFSLCHDKMKEQPPEKIDILRKFCVSWSPKFEEDAVPDVTISATYRQSVECNLAVLYGVRILTPQFFEVLIQRINASWKPVADHEDSFRIPDFDDTRFQPIMEDTLPSLRKDVKSWLPAQGRRELFKGWRILGLKHRVVPVEKRWLIAMGAAYTEIDVSKKLPHTPNEFRDLMQDWLKEVDENGQRSHSLVVFFRGVKEEFVKTKVDFNNTVGQACHELGITVCSGNVAWGTVRTHGVAEYIKEAINGRQGEKLKSPVKPTAAPRSPVRQKQPAAAAQSQAEAPVEVPARTPSQVAVPASQPDTQAKDMPPSAQRGASPDITQAPSSTVRKPLRKRAARKVDLFEDDLSVIHETTSQPMDVDDLPAASQNGTQKPPTQATQVPDSQSAATNPKNSRLKRRAGPTETHRSQYNLDFDDTFEAERKAEEAKAEIRELYEQTKAESSSKRFSGTKRQKVTHQGESLETDDSDSLPRAGQATPNAMDVGDDEDVEEVEDPIQRTLRQARQGKLTQTLASKAPSRSMGPPAVPKKSSQKVPEEAQEMIETGPAKSTRPANMTKDDGFLQAITKASRTKKDLDELDKEFNNLRIPKPTAGRKAKPVDDVATKGLGNDHPDWQLVNDFDDELRGNFIQIVRKDLYRKDGGSKASGQVNDGRPNFKKFKKKDIIRREPVKLVLSATATENAEMGEPYWQTDEPMLKGRSQGLTQGRGHDDEMPLLPRTKKPRLLEGSDDEKLPATTRRQPQAATQSQLTQEPRATSRRTRAASVVSAVSDTPSAAPAKVAKPPLKKPAASAKGKSKKASIVLEDSEEEVAMEMAKTPAASTRNSRSATGKSTRATGTTLDVEPTPRPMASAGARGTQKKKLLADDDDDLTAFRGVQKRRKLG